MTASTPQTIENPLREMPEVVEGATADLILLAAGQLFAAKGFHGTSAREIAEAVGIRKPSLFHHFESKTAMAQYLLEYDRLRSPLLLGQMELSTQPVPVRIYQSIRREVSVELTSRYELRGLYLTDLLEEPDFAFWKSQYDIALARMRFLLEEGIRHGCFVDQPLGIIEQIFDSVLTGVVRLRSRHNILDADVIATLLLRLILTRPDEAAAIRKAADDALAALRRHELEREYRSR